MDYAWKRGRHFACEPKPADSTDSCLWLKQKFLLSPSIKSLSGFCSVTGSATYMNRRSQSSGSWENCKLLFFGGRFPALVTSLFEFFDISEKSFLSPHCKSFFKLGKLTVVCSSAVKWEANWLWGTFLSRRLARRISDISGLSL